MFYCRLPGQARGRIVSITLKYFPYVYRRRPAHAAPADPGRPARRPGAAPVPAAPCRTARHRAARRPGGAAGLCRQPQPRRDLSRRQFAAHAGDGSALRGHRRAACRSFTSAASTSASPTSRRSRPARTSPSSRSTAPVPKARTSGTARRSLLKAWTDLMRQYRWLFRIGRANRDRGFKPLQPGRVRPRLPAREGADPAVPADRLNQPLSSPAGCTASDAPASASRASACSRSISAAARARKMR